ncbi:MAG TPA: hypothetical protein PLN81_05300 [Bacillota bacterium]|nr:hypothetical protein [Bacillota bacterium]HPT60997.1 hypothetical protein [Bacillota bacterium]
MNARVKKGTLSKTFTPEGVIYTVKVSKLELKLPHQLRTEAEYHLYGGFEVEVDLTEKNPLTDFVNAQLQAIQAAEERKRELKKKRKRKERQTRKMRKAL